MLSLTVQGQLPRSPCWCLGGTCPGCCLLSDLRCREHSPPLSAPSPAVPHECRLALSVSVKLSMSEEEEPAARPRTRQRAAPFTELTRLPAVSPLHGYLQMRQISFKTVTKIPTLVKCLTKLFGYLIESKSSSCIHILNNRSPLQGKRPLWIPGILP